MTHRHDQQRAVAHAQAELDVGDERKQRAFLVAADRAFRFSRGARSIHQRPRITAAHHDIGQRILGAGDQIFVGAEAGRTSAAEGDEILRRHGQIAAQRLDGAEQFILDDERPRLAVLHDVGNFRADQTKIDRHGDQPGHRGRGVDLKPLDAVVGQHADAVAFGKADADQRIGQPAGAGYARAGSSSRGRGRGRRSCRGKGAHASPARRRYAPTHSSRSSRAAINGLTTMQGLMVHGRRTAKSRPAIW